MNISMTDEEKYAVIQLQTLASYREFNCENFYFPYDMIQYSWILGKKIFIVDKNEKKFIFVFKNEQIAQTKFFSIFK